MSEHRAHAPYAQAGKKDKDGEKSKWNAQDHLQGLFQGTAPTGRFRDGTAKLESGKHHSHLDRLMGAMEAWMGERGGYEKHSQTLGRTSDYAKESITQIVQLLGDRFRKAQDNMTTALGGPGSWDWDMGAAKSAKAEMESIAGLKTGIQNMFGEASRQANVGWDSILQQAMQSGASLGSSAMSADASEFGHKLGYDSTQDRTQTLRDTGMAQILANIMLGKQGASGTSGMEDLAGDMMKKYGEQGGMLAGMESPEAAADFIKRLFEAMGQGGGGMTVDQLLELSQQ